MPGWPTYGEQAPAVRRAADDAAWRGDLELASRLDRLAAEYESRGDEIEVPF